MIIISMHLLPRMNVMLDIYRTNTDLPSLYDFSFSINANKTHHFYYEEESGGCRVVLKVLTLRSKGSGV